MTADYRVDGVETGGIDGAYDGLARRIAKDSAARLEAALRDVPAGHVLCAHAPEVTTLPYDPLSNNVTFRVRQNIHPLAPGEECAGGSERTLYHGPAPA
jgi:hypothetical protein